MRERGQMEELEVDGKILFIWILSMSMGKHEKD